MDNGQVWQWRWLGDADDAWRNSTQTECDRIACFAPDNRHWEVRALCVMPTPSAIEAWSALIANGLLGQASEEDVREVVVLIKELLGVGT